MLFYRLALPLTRWGAFAALAVGAVWWGLEGWRWTSAETPPPSAVSTERLAAELAQHDPAAAAQVEKMRARAPVATAAVATAAGADALPLLKRLADEQAATGRTPAIVELAQLALQSRELSSEEDRQAFLLSHGVYLEAIRAAESPELLRSYLADLEAAAADPQRMRASFDDPAALVVWSKVTDPELRAFYHAHRDWLGEMLVHAAGPAADESSDAFDPAAQLARVLQAARKYHPLPERAVQELKTGWLGFELFLTQGDLVAAGVKEGLPLDDVLEVLFANPEYFAQKVQSEGVEKTARRMADLRSGRPFVWLAARHSPGALRLAEVSPEDAEAIFTKYGADDLPSLFFTAYPDAVKPAARSVVQYGDLAILLLARHRDDARFQKHLADPRVGPRLIPYVALQGDAALDQLASGYGDLDKRFEADGRPKDPEWWTHIPGGGAANVVRNWRQGYPNEWSELGWAALDVADAALLVASLGSTAPASAGKAGAATAARSATKAALRSEAAELVVARAAKTAQGSRGAAQAAFEGGKATSFLQRMVRGGGAALTLGGGLRVASRAASGAAARTLELAGAVGRTWTRIPPVLRVYAARGLLAASLVFRLKNQIAPNLDKISTGLAGAAGESLKTVADLAGMTLAKTVQNFLREGLGASPTAAGWTAYAAVLLTLAGGAWWAWPGPRPKRVRYA